MMNPRRKLLVFPAMGLAAALVWPLVGGVTVAQGQEKPVVIKRAHEGSFRPSFTKPIFILALGTDSASRRYHRGGTLEGGRTDSIHIIAINPTLKKATLVGIPRDSEVKLACGGTNKINAAQVFGGTKCIIDTVENLSGGLIKFDYYIIGGFDNVENMVNAIGGVPVNIPKNLGDRNSRSAGIRKGLHTLNGHDALAYSRNRHDFATGDFERTLHQGEVMLGGLTKARQLVAKDPGKTLTFLRAVFANTHSDIPLLEAFRLGLLMLQIKPADVTNTRVGALGQSFNPRPILNNVADDAIIN